MKTSQAALVLWLTLTFSSPATQPPKPEELDAFVKDGSYARRAEFVRQMGKHKVRPDVARRTLARLNQLAGDPKNLDKAPLPRWQGMPTTGTNKVLVLLIDFPDYPHVNDASLIVNKLFGDGLPAEYPKESLRNYYRRSSYNQLEIQGTVLGWYRMQHNRSYYTSTYGEGNAANRAVMLEVIQNFDASHNFAQYDNNHDGQVDYFAVIWSGPDTGWGNFWWGYQWELQNPITADGVRFTSFSWQWESRPVGSQFSAETIIHETGHALGLPDYYDYSPNVGPPGGVGGLDMMHGNYADHNAFSKFMLEWLRPVAVPAGQSNLTLRALAQQPDAVAIMPGYTGNTPYTEFFMVEIRQRLNNDAANPGDGLLVWHVDATPNTRGEDFLFNNSDTSHKLLRLMEADGLEEIETGDGRADAGDYYNQSESISAATSPSTRAYNGAHTQVTVDSISPNGTTMTARFAIQGGSAGPSISRTPASLSQSVATGANPQSQSFQVSATGGTVSYAISDNAAWLSVAPESGSSSGAALTHTVSYNTASLAPGTYQAVITITAPGAANSPQTLSITLAVMGGDLGQALDTTNLTWTAGGDAAWFQQSTITHDGADAAQSGVLTDNQSCWFQTTVTGPGELTFWWKVSSELNYDFLRLYVDGVESPEKISGSTEWIPVTVSIAAGPHTLRWAYTKDYSIASGMDAAWVDEVHFIPANQTPVLSCSPVSLTQIASVGQSVAPQTLLIWNAGGGSMTYNITSDAAWLSVSPAAETSSGGTNQHQVSYDTTSLTAGTYNANLTITAAGATGSPITVPVTLRLLAGGGTLAEALDDPTGTWSTAGDAQWTPQTSVTHDSQDAAASGAIAHNQACWIERTVTGPGTISFWWKVSSEQSFDFLYLALDGAPQSLAISGEVDWRAETFFVPPGSHTVRWVYEKDYSVVSGADAGWVDQVAFTPGGSGPQVVLSADFNDGLPAGWQVADYAGYGATWVFFNPGNRSNLTGGSGGFAIADSDYFSMFPMDTDLITPPLNFTGYSNVVIEFKSDFLVYSGNESAAVQVELNNSGNYINLWVRNTSDRGPKTITLDVPQAANQSNVVFYFYYANADNDFWWEVDDVRIIATPMTSPGSGGMLAEWRQAWQHFDQNYALFPLKGVPWAPVHDTYTNLFASVPDATQFAVQLNNVLQSLHDWNIQVRQPSGTWLGYGGVFPPNHPSSLLTNYTGGAPYTDVKNTHAIYHAWLGYNLAHLVVQSLDPAAFAPITDADLDAIFTLYRNASGMILDLRANTGGAESNAVRIASRFTTLPRTYGYTRTRTPGNDHYAFGPYTPKILFPSTGVQFTNHVIGLIGQRTVGAAEWFTLMIRACPQITLLGDRTRGASGDPQEFALPSINVSYLIPRTIGLDTDQVPFEDTGIAPHLAMVPGPASYNDALQKDYVLEQATFLLRRPRLAINTLPGNRFVISWPADPGGLYTLLRSTNLADPLWRLAPGWTSNRPGVSGVMSYTNTQPGPVEAYRLQLR